MLLLIIFWLSLLGVVSTVSSFQFPSIKFVGISNDLNTPRILVQNGDSDKLLQKLKKHCAKTIRDDKDSIKDIQWYPNLEVGYEVADVLFKEVERALSQDNDGKRRSIILSFPSMKRQDDLEKLAQVLKSDKCKELLCIENSFAELYPSSPSPYLHITFCTNVNAKSEVVDYEEVPKAKVREETSITSTKEWVNNFLGRFRLCPYTSSISRAAVGLSSVGVPIGGVHIVKVDDSTNLNNDNVKSQRAAKLVSAFWSEVVTLMQSEQDEWATSLIISPEYDTDFESFVDVCDSIIEPTVVATQSTEFIGRAWFHPLYNADLVGHSEVIAGHSVPHKMVQEFIQSLAKDDESILEYDEISKANDRVRQTPHATVNILRRSQLNAAAEYEKNLGDKRPKPNSIYVRNTRRLAEVIDDNI